MFEVDEKPATVGLVKPDPYGGNDDYLLKESSSDELRGRVLRTRDCLKEKYPGLAAQIDVACSLFWGFALAPEEEETAGPLTSEQKLTSARIQHTIVHHAFYAGNASAPDEFSAGIYRAVAAMEKAAQQLGRAEEDWSFATLLSGAKSELAVAKTLASDYQVWLPDYTPGTVPEDDEVLQMDVFSGVDLIAQERDLPYLYLINVKGRREVKSCSVDCQYQSAGELSPAIQKVIRATAPKYVIRAEITIPTGSLHLGQAAAFGGDYRTEMGRFCVLPEEAQKSIISGLRSNIRDVRRS